MEKTNDELNREIYQHNQDGIRLLGAANEIHRVHQLNHENSPLSGEEMKQAGDKTREAASEFHEVIELQSELIEKQRQTINQELEDLSEFETVKPNGSEKWFKAALGERRLENDLRVYAGVDRRAVSSNTV